MRQVSKVIPFDIEQVAVYSGYSPIKLAPVPTSFETMRSNRGYEENLKACNHFLQPVEIGDFVSALIVDYWVRNFSRQSRND